MMMESLGREVAPRRIRVNSIVPGAVRAPSIYTAGIADERAYEGLMARIPYERIGEPIYIARAAAWLVSEDSDFVIRATSFVDSSMTLRPGFATGA